MWVCSDLNYYTCLPKGHLKSCQGSAEKWEGENRGRLSQLCRKANLRLWRFGILFFSLSLSDTNPCLWLLALTSPDWCKSAMCSHSCPRSLTESTSIYLFFFKFPIHLSPLKLWRLERHVFCLPWLREYGACDLVLVWIICPGCLLIRPWCMWRCESTFTLHQ